MAENGSRTLGASLLGYFEGTGPRQESLKPLRDFGKHLRPTRHDVSGDIEMKEDDKKAPIYNQGLITKGEYSPVEDLDATLVHLDDTVLLELRKDVEGLLSLLALPLAGVELLFHLVEHAELGSCIGLLLGPNVLLIGDLLLGPPPLGANLEHVG